MAIYHLLFDNVSVSQHLSLNKGKMSKLKAFYVLEVNGSCISFVMISFCSLLTYFFPSVRHLFMGKSSFEVSLFIK